MIESLRPFARQLSVAAVYLALLALMFFFAPRFFDAEFVGTFVRAAPMIVLAVGMTFVIVSRHIDISIGSQFSVCAVIAGVLARDGAPLPLVLILTVFAGVLMSAVNAALVAVAGLPSIVVTLATMVVYRESLRWVGQGEMIRGLPDSFQWLGLSQTGGEILLVTIALLILLSAMVATRFLVVGRLPFAVGSDSESARLAGIRPPRVVFGVFILMGALTAVASMMNAVRFPQIDPNSGLGVELGVIAAVVVGGTAITGGRGSLVGSLLGVMLLITIGPVLTFLDMPPQWERAIQGAIILVAVAAESVRRRRAT